MKHVMHVQETTDWTAGAATSSQLSSDSLSYCFELTEDSLSRSRIDFRGRAGPGVLGSVGFLKEEAMRTVVLGVVALAVFVVVRSSALAAENSVPAVTYVESQKVLDNFEKKGGNPLITGRRIQCAD